MQLFYDVMAGIAYLIVIPLALLAPLLVRMVYGPSYAEAGSILRVYAWALLFVFLGVARTVGSSQKIWFGLVCSSQS